VPDPGESWQPVGDQARQAHADVRNGTAKLLPRLRPCTGEVRATGVRTAPNVVVPPWLRDQLSRILATLPAVSLPEAERPVMARWETWLGHVPREPRPPLRLILVGDNLAGHRSYASVRWLLQQGVMPLNTPLAGSWRTMAESLQRIIVRRAVAGQHPQTPAESITWLEETVDAWNAAPTPFVGDGKRRARRLRARARRLGGSAATVAYRQLNAA
jgi:hypothetical protein